MLAGHRDALDAHVGDQTEQHQQQPAPQHLLGQVLSGGDRGELADEAGVELGVSVFSPPATGKITRCTVPDGSDKAASATRSSIASLPRAFSSSAPSSLSTFRSARVLIFSTRDEQVHQRIGDLRLPDMAQRGRQRRAPWRLHPLQVRRVLLRRPRPPGVDQLLRHVREQGRGQLQPPHPLRTRFMSSSGSVQTSIRSSGSQSCRTPPLHPDRDHSFSSTRGPARRNEGQGNHTALHVRSP